VWPWSILPEIVVAASTEQRLKASGTRRTELGPARLFRRCSGQLHRRFVPVCATIAMQQSLEQSIKYREDIVRAAVNHKFDPGLVRMRY
jgi:hypothetical protein